MNDLSLPTMTIECSRHTVRRLIQDITYLFHDYLTEKDRVRMHKLRDEVKLLLLERFHRRMTTVRSVCGTAQVRLRIDAENGVYDIYPRCTSKAYIHFPPVLVLKCRHSRIEPCEMVKPIIELLAIGCYYPESNIPETLSHAFGAQIHLHHAIPSKDGTLMYKGYVGPDLCTNSAIADAIAAEVIHALFPGYPTTHEPLQLQLTTLCMKEAGITKEEMIQAYLSDCHARKRIFDRLPPIHDAY